MKQKLLILMLTVTAFLGAGCSKDDDNKPLVCKTCVQYIQFQYQGFPMQQSTDTIGYYCDEQLSEIDGSVVDTTGVTQGTPWHKVTTTNCH